MICPHHEDLVSLVKETRDLAKAIQDTQTSMRVELAEKRGALAFVKTVVPWVLTGCGIGVALIKVIQ